MAIRFDKILAGEPILHEVSHRRSVIMFLLVISALMFFGINIGLALTSKIFGIITWGQLFGAILLLGAYWMWRRIA